MRAFLTCAILTVTILTINAAPVSAQPGPYARLVDGWYHRYLGRHVDPRGSHDHVAALRHGTPIDVVEASILSGPEYYARNGATPEGYVAALHRDVLGRRAGPFEFSRDVNCVLTHGRNVLAMRLIQERNTMVAPVVVARPAPLYVAPAPVIVPTYRHAPHYYGPAPGFSLRIGIR